MNILYIHSTTEIHGSSLSLLALIDGMISQKHTPLVVVPDENSRFIVELKSRRVKYFVVPLLFHTHPYLPKWNQLRGYLGSIRYRLNIWSENANKLEQIIKSNDIDIVHTNVGPLFDGHYAAKKCHIPHVWHVREYGDKDFNHYIFPSKLYYHHLLRQDYPICITKDLLSYNNLGSYCNARVVYNGVASKKEACIEENKENIFLCASRISSEKGQDQAIRSFAIFSRIFSNFKLIILGDWVNPYKELLDKLCRQLEIEDKVVFEGYRPNVKDYMRKSKALLVPSEWEGFGRMTAEAGIFGTMVIGRNHAGTKEIIELTGGYLYDTEEEMTMAMIDIARLSSKEYKEQMHKIQEKALRHFTSEQYVEELINVYSKAMIDYGKA